MRGRRNSTMGQRGLQRLAGAIVALFAAVELGPQRPAWAETIYALTIFGELVRFEASSPSVWTSVGPVSGLVPNHRVRAIDFRPATGELYLLSSGGTGVTNNQAQLYTVDLTTAGLTRVGSGLVLAGSSSPRISVDFDPATDWLRVLTGTRQNYRVSPVTGSLVAQDANVFYGAGDPYAGQVPETGDLAFAAGVAGGPSTLFHLDAVGAILATMPTPNTGRLVTRGTSGLELQNLFTVENTIGMDISMLTGRAFVTTDLVLFDGVNYSFDPIDRLFEVNLATGRFSLLGTTGLQLLDMAVVVPEPSAVAVGVAVWGALGVAGANRRHGRRAAGA